ncbi:MAG TPA: lanthionine synthetase LanC family protein, partial [Thermoanaerobaculia bacterium]|nr:lanthionine synthetase LanC family protein [Thermoanaerobaculia bacterium]
MATEFLDTALAIGRRLAHRALWEGTTCTWEVLKPQPDPQGRVRTVRAGGQLYQGAAGIAWFLGELYRATGDAEVGRAARGGLEHALACGDDLSDLFGFHSGRVGLAWVAVRLAEIFEHPDDAGRARRLLAPLAGQESHDSGLDVIGGAGGAIPACLDLAERAGWDELRAVARGLGEHLIAQAQRRPDGWSWATGGESAVRNLTGFAHGVSGMGLALLELDRATGDGRFRFAAEMAFLYERRLFNEKHSNWPDLRHKDLGEALFEQRMDELRRMVRDGKPPV